MSRVGAGFKGGMDMSKVEPSVYRGGGQTKMRLHPAVGRDGLCGAGTEELLDGQEPEGDRGVQREPGNIPTAQA